MKSSAPIVGLLGLLLLQAPRVSQAQFIRFDGLPTVTVSTNKTEYERFEPIIVTLEVTNNTQKHQEWGPPGWGEADKIGVALNGPDLKFVPYHGILHSEGISLLDPQVTYAPGQTRSRSFNLLVGINAWSETGTYEVLAEFLPPRQATDLGSTFFDVLDVDGMDVALADSLAEAAYLTFSARAWSSKTPDVKAILERVIDDASTPSHVLEFAVWIYAIYTEYDLGVSEARRQSLELGPRPTQSEVDQLYTDFLSTYPNSAFATAAEQRLVGLETFYGVEPWIGSEQTDPLPISLKAKLFLEGTFSSGVMSSSLSPPEGTTLSLTSPYEDEPWNSPYPASMPQLFDPLVDWVYGLIVDTTATPDSVVARSAGVVMESGLVGFEFPRFASGEYLVIVQHRNHLAVASDTTVDFATGYAEHDFTTGHSLRANSQKVVDTTATGDPIYAMWAGDANVDCQITVGDFNEWLVDTKAFATGYLQTDFNLDAQATVGDFNLWLANTKAVAQASDLCTQLYGTPSNAKWMGGFSAAASKTSIANAIRAKYRIQGNAIDSTLSVRINTKTNPTTDVDTLGSATFDVYYNSDQLIYMWPVDYSHLLEAGYSFYTERGSNEYGAFVRVEIYTSSPDTVSVEIDGNYSPKLLQLRFWDNNTAITSHDIAFNLATLNVAVISDGVVVEPEETIPVYDDVYNY